ncbi:hypothetical protein [Streptomyces sp. NPDC048496]|uniref:hypothetical protein n=1 Tax=Streptomyces sp. NPDC048496 TaxID=3365558 RepID=UPI0037216E13
MSGSRHSASGHGVRLHEWPEGHASQESGHLDRRLPARTGSYARTITCRPAGGASTPFDFSAPSSVLGAALFVAGSVRKQTSAHVFEVIEKQKSEERSRQK